MNFRRLPSLTVATGLAVVLAGGIALAQASFGSPQPDYPKTYEGITPTSYAGNFASSDNDQVCYDLMRLGLIGQLTGELRGFKVDPPGPYSDGLVDVILSADGKYLAWVADGASVAAFVIKGGPSFHVYDYVGSGVNADSWLVSPKSGRNIPQISHYNGCYEINEPGGNGCTPGYWRNHYDRWSGYTAGQIFDTVFGVTYLGGTVTLGQAIANPQTYGTFAFHAVAALLNSTGGVPNGDGTTVSYPLATADVIDIVRTAVGTGETEDAKDQLAGLNELGCPLDGTAACNKLHPQACLP